MVVPAILNLDFHKYPDLFTDQKNEKQEEDNQNVKEQEIESRIKELQLLKQEFKSNQKSDSTKFESLLSEYQLQNKKQQEEIQLLKDQLESEKSTSQIIDNVQEIQQIQNTEKSSLININQDKNFREEKNNTQKIIYKDPIQNELQKTFSEKIVNVRQMSENEFIHNLQKEKLELNKNYQEIIQKLKLREQQVSKFQQENLKLKNQLIEQQSKIDLLENTIEDLQLQKNQIEQFQSKLFNEERIQRKDSQFQINTFLLAVENLRIQLLFKDLALQKDKMIGIIKDLQSQSQSQISN